MKDWIIENGQFVNLNVRNVPPSAVVSAWENAENKNLGKGTSYGLRVCDHVYEVGDAVRPSRVWDDGFPTDEYLPGTCTIGVNADWPAGMTEIDVAGALKLLEKYTEKHVYLLRGYGHSGGEDMGELIISDAVVVGVLS